MVLSNKKLKGKLRIALAEAAVANSKQHGDANSNVAHLEELRSARKGTSKREKRRQKKELLNEEAIQGAENNKDQASQDNEDTGSTKKLKEEKNKCILTEDNGIGMEDKDTQLGNKNAHLENKSGHLQKSGNEGSKTNEKKKRKKGEDKDIQLDQNYKSDDSKKGKKKKNKGTLSENNGTGMEDKDTQLGIKNAHLENKGGHLQNGGNEGSKTNKKKNRKRGEDKDIQLDQICKSEENRGDPIKTNGDHLENGDVEESKSNNNKKKKQQKQNRKSEQGTVDKLASSVVEKPSEDIIINAEEPSDDIIINAHEVTVSESQEKYDALKVYVGGIPYYSNEDDIRSFFDGCGSITEVDCMTFPDSGKFRGIALISFKTEAAAKRALALDGSDMGGRYLKIEKYKTVKSSKNENRTGFEPTKVDNSNRAYIGNLSWDITEDDLKSLFEDCEISAIRFGMDKTTGEFKGYGHIDFADDVSLAMALKLDQEVVCGRPIRISYALPKRDSELDSNIKSTSEKKKRRTCYTCGEPGHLSNSCPQIQSTEIVDANGGVVKTNKEVKLSSSNTADMEAHFFNRVKEDKANTPVVAVNAIEAKNICSVLTIDGVCLLLG
ncbi:hypothetical protein KI387_006527 [Taxus chinensis]|uniref:Uncharacterized protein n=1 Tax=Taxus chinensis TaxID=29808 RepID=A0AA38GMV7_TAXCH|nr:hypothetical protein KI387_006527 [Taxus chinensis]